MKRELRAHVSIMEQAILANREKMAEFKFISETCHTKEESAEEMKAITKRLVKLKKKFMADEGNIKTAKEEFKKKNGAKLTFRTSN